MRSEEEMMSLIMEKAQMDDRVRAVYMNGSRINPEAVQDKYSDFDIVYIVRDIRTFTGDSNWIEYFGEILIIQKPTDWYSHPYDYGGAGSFSYLMQFKDGNRIDLTLIDETNIESAIKDTDPRKILLNKDGIEGLLDIPAKDFYHIEKPGEKEFSDCCNEFFWVSLYVAKGICREELMYSRIFMEHTVMDMLLKMLSWSLGIDHDFSLCIGKNYRYLKNYLSPEDMDILKGFLSKGEFQDMWDKLIKMLAYFKELSGKVACALKFAYDSRQAEQVRDYILGMKAK